MKRIITVLIAVLMIGVVLCSCGKKDEKAKNVTTTVPAKYDDGYAEKYADSFSTDDDGNVVYKFSGDKYDEYLKSHKNTLGKEVQGELKMSHTGTDDEAAKYGEYAYIKDDANAVIIGVHKKEYDKKVAEKESAIAAEYGFKYFQNLEKPVDTITVIYCDANNQDTVFGEFEYTAD